MCDVRLVILLTETLWPSGPRRWLKAPFRKGVGSKPTVVIGFDALGPAVQMRQCYVVCWNKASTPMTKEIGSTKKAGEEENKLRADPNAVQAHLHGFRYCPGA